MARKKKEKQSSADAAKEFGREVWGIIYLSIGILVLVSLSSHFISTQSNILGRYVGTSLAAGLVALFGPLTSYAFPVAILYCGISALVLPPIKVRTLVYLGLFTLQICVLLAISPAPITNFTPNFFGNLFAYFFQKIFGLHRFGPYFIVSITLFLTIVVAFRINVSLLANRAWNGCKQAFAFVGELLHRETAQIKRPALETATATAAPEPKKPKKDDSRKKQKNQANANGGSEDSPENPDPKSPGEVPTSQLEAELAEFRAKKSQPIKITTPDEAPVEEIEDDDSEDEMSEQIVRRLAAAAAENESEPAQNAGDTNGESDSPEESEEDQEGDYPDDYYKVPQQEAEAKAKKPTKPYEIPAPEVIPDPPAYSAVIDRDEIERNSQILEKTLGNFGLEGKVVNVSPGPIITRYEIELAPGVKVSRVMNLQDDISLAVGGQKIRIQAPIPGKAAIGIELPNETRQTVFFKHVLNADAFQKTKAKLPIIVGRSISGAPFVADITKMPHLLIAGQTGAGKSVCINSFICSMLMTKSPEELRLIMIDPKKVELSYYQGIPHLLSPVVTESKEAVKALHWGMIEMDRRYRLLAKVGARNIESFNNKVTSGAIKDGTISEQDNKALPFIVIIIDELADLMITAAKEVETSIQRIAQLARAVGIHLIVATQRPSVDIITGTIKANLTSRIAFRTIQSNDSRTILGHVGAEKLLGLGDMLFLRNGAPDIERYHGAFISEEDVEVIVNQIKTQESDVEVIESFEEATRESGGASMGDSGGGGGGFDSDRDDLFADAARTIVTIGQGSTSLLQRRMKIGFARAGRLMDELERAGVVGPSEGSKAREVLMQPDELEDVLSGLGY